MGQSFKLPRFKAGEPLLDQLTAERLNSMLAAIESNRTIIGTNMTGNWSPAGTVVRAAPQSSGSGKQKFPFKVTCNEFEAQVYPGTIARIVPTIFGVALDHRDVNGNYDAAFSGVGSDFDLLLKVSVDLTHGVNFRGGVTTVIVVDSISESDYAGTGELAMTWDDDPTNTIGHFYIKIANIKVDGDGNFSLDTQWLFESYDSFLINDPDVIILE